MGEYFVFGRGLDMSVSDRLVSLLVPSKSSGVREFQC